MSTDLVEVLDRSVNARTDGKSNVEHEEKQQETMTTTRVDKKKTSFGNTDSSLGKFFILPLHIFNV